MYQPYRSKGYINKCKMAATKHIVLDIIGTAWSNSYSRRKHLYLSKCCDWDCVLLYYQYYVVLTAQKQFHEMGNTRAPLFTMASVGSLQQLGLDILLAMFRHNATLRWLAMHGIEGIGPSKWRFFTGWYMTHTFRADMMCLPMAMLNKASLHRIRTCFLSS